MNQHKAQQKLESAGETVFRVSSVSGAGIEELINYLSETVKNERIRENQFSVNMNSHSSEPNSIWED